MPTIHRTRLDPSVSIAERSGGRLLTLDEAEGLGDDREALERIEMNVRALVDGESGGMTAGQLGALTWYAANAVTEAEARLELAELIQQQSIELFGLRNGA
jgi:hypothetical protein